MCIQAEARMAGHRVPELDCVVVSAGGEERAIGRERHTAYKLGVRSGRPAKFAGLRIPHSKAVGAFHVVACRRQELPIRRESDRPGLVRAVSHWRGPVHSAHRTPEPGDVVGATQRDHSPVRRERDSGNAPVRKSERRHRPSGDIRCIEGVGHVPELSHNSRFGKTPSGTDRQLASVRGESDNERAAGTREPCTDSP